MSEELQEVEQQAEETQESETDWQAKYEAMRDHMRDWEKKAKANQSAADELEQLKTAQMTEQEKVTARAEKAEAELATLKAEAEKVDAARRISTETGVSFEMLMAALQCNDADSLKEFAKRIQSEQPVTHAAASTNRSRVTREQTKTHGEMFADAVSDLF